MNEPIFIVGAPRSGTTLLAAMLAAHSQLSCGPETHFFRWLSEADIQALTAADQWPEAAVDFVCTITRTNFPDHERKLLIENYQVDREQVREYLQAKPPSVAAMLASITESFMRHMGKTRWVEKTPDHIEYVSTIRQYFPNSPIIRILRDPRDIVLSLTNVPWGVSSIMEGLLFWKRQDEASRTFFDTDPNSYTIRFEDLIQSPEEELAKLVKFIGESFEISMLDTSQTGKLVNSRNVAWKNKSSQPLDRSRVEVWRTKMTVDQSRLAESVLGDRMDAYGYPRQHDFSRLGEIYPALQLATKYSPSLEMIAAKGVRLWKTHESEPVTVKIYLGDPENNGWMKGQPSEKIRDTMALSTKIVKAISSSNQDVYWIVDGNDEGWTGTCAFILKKLLNSSKIVPNPK